MRGSPPDVGIDCCAATAGSTREPMQEAIERFEEEATEGLK
jgi:hypothetical protein